MSEPVTIAVPVERHDALLTFVAQVQVTDWDRLLDSVRRAANGYWSMEVEWVILRIRHACALVDPTEVGEVPWAVFASGLYDAVLKDVARTEPDPAIIAEYREAMTGRLSMTDYAACVRAAGRLRDKGIDTID